MEGLSPKLKNFIFDKLMSDIGDALYQPYAGELWFITPNDKCWYFVVESDGKSWYNEKFFNNFFSLFSMKSSEYSPLLKEWIELKTEIPIRQISRKNTNYHYVIDNVLKRSEYNDWSLKERWGFSFFVVKKYVEGKKILQTESIRLKDYF